MYKPLFLGISNAGPSFILVPIALLVFFVGLFLIACIIVYFTGYYLIKLFGWLRNYSLRIGE